MITILDRYIGRRMLVGVAVVTGVLVSLFTLVVLVDALRDYGQGEFGLAALIEYVLLSQPRRLYEAFPVVALLGALMGLTALAVHSELIALRAAGVSIARIIAATMKTGLLLVVAVVLLGEFVVPAAETRAQEGRAKAMASGLQTRQSGLWLRDGGAFVNLGEVLPDRRLLRVVVYDFRQDGDDRQLRTLIQADRAQLLDNHWALENVQLSRITAQGLAREARATLDWPSTLTGDVIAAFTVRPEGLSLLNLRSYIAHLASHGQETGRYRLSYWQKLMLPFAVAVMVLLATPFVFRHARAGGMAGRLFIGVLLGLGFLLANRSFGYLGLIYGVPPWLGATLPIAAFLLLSLWLLRRAG
jgi:lipopolysaccharide export system permease protein